jgi:hypothetical protein
MARGYASGLLTGLAVSAVGVLFAPLLSQWGRGAAKTAIKGGLVAYHSGRARVAELGEQLEDLIAEAQVELATEQLDDRPPAGAE